MWYGFTFNVPQPVQCIALHQGDSGSDGAQWKMPSLRLKFKDDLSNTWVEAAQWSTPHAEYSASINPLAIPVPCGPPRQPHADFTACTQYTHASKCTGVCATGYTGQATAVCTKDGVWDYTEVCAVAPGFSTNWRLFGEEFFGEYHNSGHWTIKEIAFYRDQDCSVPLPTAPFYVDPESPEGAYRAVDGTGLYSWYEMNHHRWFGFKFDAAEKVKCVKLEHGRNDEWEYVNRWNFMNRMPLVRLKYLQPENDEWVEAARFHTPGKKYLLKVPEWGTCLPPSLQPHMESAGFSCSGTFDTHAYQTNCHGACAVGFRGNITAVCSEGGLWMYEGSCDLTGFVLGATLSSPSITHWGMTGKQFNPDRPNSVGLFTDDRPLEVQADFGASVQITGFWTMYDAHPFTMKVRNSPDDEWVLHHTGFGTCAFPEPAVARYAQVIFESTKQAPSWVSGYRGVLGRFMGHVVEPGFSNHWRLYNGNVVMGSWAIREVIFYSDRDCTQPLPRTERVDHYFDHHKGLPDVSSSQQEHLAISAMDESETTYWQVSDEASASCEEAECQWYGFKFFAAVTVQCVELHQGDSPNTEQALYKMNPIRLKYLDSRGEWAQAAQWDTPDADQILKVPEWGTCLSPVRPNVDFTTCSAFVFESTCHGTCVHGYVGSPTALCSEGGYWTHSGSCEPGTLSSHWRLYNGVEMLGTDDEGSWAIRDVTFYSDLACTVPLPRTSPDASSELPQLSRKPSCGW